jgi:hypothetical protein
MISAPAIILGRCDPYGAESGGPKRVLGGLYGPNSARTEGMHLPENVEQGEWACDQPAVIRCRMICRHGHKGQVMNLCSWHDVTVNSGEMVAGTFRTISRTERQRGHFEEIQRRQAGSCPACLFPPPYAELAKEIQAWQATLTGHWVAGPRAWHSPEAARLRQQVDDAGKMMDLARAQGIIHNCPLTLIPVS